MKRVFLISVVMLSMISTFGCACYSPVFRNPCISPFGLCANGSGGVVDYIDGGVDHSVSCGGVSESCGGVVYETACEPCVTPSYGGHFSCGRVGCRVGYPCSNCVLQLTGGVRMIGEAALSAAATPFLVVGNVLCSAGKGYESFPDCGCGNEIYLGDNCYQSHDFIDPCSPCGSIDEGCKNGTIQNGIQFDDPNTPNQNVIKKQSINNTQNNSEQKIVIVSPKKQPTLTNKKTNIRQATYIINQK
ncbi:MAG: hypothetical protein LBP59_16760 [Planctomycetaceae bacterium]|jgi:hypothetical protein|nr:hypothetical protein [Planctomycetaceae bacterium]